MAHNGLERGQTPLRLHEGLRNLRHGAVLIIADAGRADIDIVLKRAKRRGLVFKRYGLGCSPVAVHRHKTVLHIRRASRSDNCYGCGQNYFIFNHFQRSLNVDFLPYIRIPTL